MIDESFEIHNSSGRETQQLDEKHILKNIYIHFKHIFHSFSSLEVIFCPVIITVAENALIFLLDNVIGVNISKDPNPLLMALNQAIFTNRWVYFLDENCV